MISICQCAIQKKLQTQSKQYLDDSRNERARDLSPIWSFQMPQLLSLALVVIIAFTHLAIGSNIAHQINQYKHNFKSHAAAQRLENARLRLNGATVKNLVVNASNFATAAVGFQLYTTDTLPTTPVPSTSCSNAMTATIACNATVQLMSYTFDATSLSAMCTNSCSSSIQSYRANVASACNGVRFVGSNNATYPGTVLMSKSNAQSNMA